MRRKTDNRKSDRKTEIIQIKISPSLKDRFQKAIVYEGVDLRMSVVLRSLIISYVEKFEKTGVIIL